MSGLTQYSKHKILVLFPKIIRSKLKTQKPLFPKIFELHTDFALNSRFKGKQHFWQIRPPLLLLIKFLPPFKFEIPPPLKNPCPHIVAMKRVKRKWSCIFDKSVMYRAASILETHGTCLCVSVKEAQAV